MAVRAAFGVAFLGVVAADFIPLEDLEEGGVRVGEGLEDAEVCPDDVRQLSEFRCVEFKRALEGMYGNVTESTGDFRWAESCLYYEFECVLDHPTEGVQVLVEKFDFDSEKCNRKVLIEYNYTINVGGANHSIRTYHPMEIGTGEEVLLPNLLKILDDDNHEETQALRVQLRDGIEFKTVDGKNITRSGFFFRAELATFNKTLNKLQNNFAQFMMVKAGYISTLCPHGLASTGASYSEYADPECSVFIQEITYLESDGICTRAFRRSVDGQQNYVYATSLCEDNRLYVTTPSTEERCLEVAASTTHLKQNADMTFTLSTDRGQCIPRDGVYLRLSEGSCKPREDICVWREGKYNGETVLIDTDVTQYNCLLTAMQSEQFSKFCGVEWVEAAGSVTGKSSCYGIKGSCKGPYGSRVGEWGCLLRSTATEEDNDTTLTLVVFLVIICVLCPVLFLVLLIGASRYLRAKWARSRRDQPHTVVDSGRTTGVVTGVPVPAPRQMEHADDEDRCSAAPFEPDPNVTVNPLKLLDGEDAETTVVDGRLETIPDEATPAPSESPTYTNDRRPLRREAVEGVEVPPPNLEGDTALAEEEVSNGSTDNIPF